MAGRHSAFAFLDVNGRIARKLLDLAGRHGQAVTGGVRIEVRLPQAELAAMVGASRENVNRSLGQLVTLGALSMYGAHHGSPRTSRFTSARRPFSRRRRAGNS